MIGNCHGARIDGTVRPLALCLKCAHWLRIAGDVIEPQISTVKRLDRTVVVCRTRKPVKARPASPGRV